MRLVNINLPGTVGYSVACNGESIYSIIAHTRNESSDAHAEAYADVGLANRSWVYMPLAHGETITGVYRRVMYGTRPSPRPLSSLGLVVSICCKQPSIPPSHALLVPELMIHDDMQLATNYGRRHEFGPFWGGYFQNSNVRCLARLPNSGPCRMFFNRLDKHRFRLRMHLVTSDRDDAVHPPDHAGEPPPPGLMDEMRRRQSPACVGPFRGPLPRGLYSSCSLENVASIRLCMDATAPHRPVVGMLVSYADGRLDACVGEWRFDWVAAADKAIVVAAGPSDGLHVCHRRFRPDRFLHWPKQIHHRYGGYYVAAITAHAPGQNKNTDNDGDDDFYKAQWTTVPWSGILEWWFLSHRSYLYHDGIRIRPGTGG